MVYSGMHTSFIVDSFKATIVNIYYRSLSRYHDRGTILCINYRPLLFQLSLGSRAPQTLNPNETLNSKPKILNPKAKT